MNKKTLVIGAVLLAAGVTAFLYLKKRNGLEFLHPSDEKGEEGDKTTAAAGKLSVGSTGEEVKTLQKLLNKQHQIRVELVKTNPQVPVFKGWKALNGNILTVDGKFGPKTKEVMSFYWKVDVMEAKRLSELAQALGKWDSSDKKVDPLTATIMQMASLSTLKA